MTHTQIDYSLYVITDRKISGESSFFNFIQSAIRGGATVIQYREKDMSVSEMIEQGKILYNYTKEANIPFIINDNVNIALAINADGVHLGQGDMPAFLARKMLGENKILGITAQTVEQALQAVRDGADYLGVGDIFGTTTKPDAGDPIGLERLKEIARAVSIPVVGIGGINKENAASVISSGASGIAVVSAIFGKPDPEEETRQLMDIVKSVKERIIHV